MPTSIYQTQFGRKFTGGKNLPMVSTEIDSIRAYQFECQFQGVPAGGSVSRDFTLAAKQVTPVGFSVEDITVDRVNDRMFYPGKASPEEITITFDNLLLRTVATDLWGWFKNSYDPMTGELTKSGGFKALKLSVLQLDNVLNPHASSELYGVWVKSWKTAEFNYATNEFHTIEVTFRYDFMDHFNH